MSGGGGGGKKKSGFQITSVTSDYGQKEAAAGGGDGKAPPSPRVSRGPAAAAGGGEEAEPLEEDGQRADGGAAGPQNGPAALLQGGASSRFRVVRLDQGLGETYKRGRWTCRDSYEQEAEAQPLAGRLADAARLPQSLDSRLEVAGLLARPQSPFSPQPPRRGAGGGLQSQLVLPPPGPSGGHQARSLGGGLPILQRPNRTPPSPASLRSPLAAPATRSAAAPADEPPEPGPSSPVRSLLVEEQLLPKSVSQLIQREAEERRKVLPRQCRSRPSSPAPPLFRDASPSRRTSDPFGAARFSLARSMFGAAHDNDDDSGTNSSMVAIDNKIEQAMDLVKSHLMFAVREEVEVLREQIKELLERNALLEQENALLRSLAGAEQLSHGQAQTQPPAAQPPPGGSA